MTTAILIDAFGGPEQMRLGEYEPGAPGPGEALIRQRVMGVNYSDVSNRRGQRLDAKPPLIIGREGVGTIEAVGPGDNAFRVGARVAYTSLLGGYAERRVVPVDKLVSVPAGIDDLHAMPLMMRGMTAHYLLFDIGAIGPGRTMLVYSAAGELKAAFGNFGSEPNHFGLPNGIAYDPTSNGVVVADANNNRVMLFPLAP